MNNRGIITVIIGIIVLSLGISLHRISSKPVDLQYEFLSKPIAEPSDMESAGDKASVDYGNAEAFDAESSDAILFIERKITSLEPCRISAGSIILDIPLGAVSSEKDVTVRGLRDDELPALDYGLVNVTSTYGGYRCLPHGKFNRPLQLSIGYDTLLIPAGYSPHDIRTFFYDEDRMEWVCMPVDSIDQEHQLVVTSTDHFTDFINGILTQPEIPEANGYAHTSIRKLEYADPLEGMNIMQAPTANNSGNCSMSYPIVLPAGRNGMTPQISISYSSDVKDGIMGPGWSLNIPSISVDTRWGVPPYSPDVESESYIVNGEAIVEATITSEGITRSKPLYVEAGPARDESGYKTYAYLTEGKFDSITRIGTSPRNYYWKVIDREGMEYIYGDIVNTDNCVTPLRFTLTDDYPNNNIAVWGLAKVKDPHGNTINYNYEVESNQSGAKQMRIKEIKYTGYETRNESGPYKITFQYQEEPIVAQLSGIYGFLTSDIRMLSKIRVTYSGDNGEEFVKCYRFIYGEGASHKKVLKAIAEITDIRLENEVISTTNNIQRQGLYVHYFDYYTEDAITFERGESISVSAGESTSIIGRLVESKPNISKNTSFSVTGGGSACVGFNDQKYYKKSNTFGVNYHYSYDRNNQKTQLLDLNGDGVVDRIEKAGRDVLFYKGTLGNGRNVSFEETAVPLNNGIPRLSKSETHTNSVGTEALFEAFLERFSGDIGFCYSRTKTINSDFFIDVNGDGFTDYVADKNVYLNFPNEDGIPQFTDMSSVNGPVDIPYDDCYNFEYDGEVDVSFSEEAGWESSSMKRDPVVYWRCPEDGLYIFTFEIRNPEYNTNSIMGFSRFYNNNNWVHGKYGVCPDFFNEETAELSRGDYYMFHFHPISGQSIDIFNQCDIKIKKVESQNSIIDADGKNILSFDYGEDAVIQDGNPFVAPKSGYINWSTIIDVPKSLSDNLNFYLIHNIYNASEDEYNPVRIDIHNEEIDGELNSGQAIGLVYDNDNGHPLHVQQNDQLFFKLESNSNVDWSSISFTSNVKYSSIDNAEPSSDGFDATYNTYHPSVGMSIYSRQIGSTSPLSMSPGDHSVVPSWALVNYLNTHTDADIYLTVKITNQLVAKRKLVSGLESIPFTLPPNEDDNYYDVYFEYTVNGGLEVSDADIVENDVRGMCYVVVDNNVDPHKVRLSAELTSDIRILGNLYRGWGQFSYKVDESVIGNQNPIDFFTYNHVLSLGALDLTMQSYDEDWNAISNDPNALSMVNAEVDPQDRIDYNPEASDADIEGIAEQLQSNINNSVLAHPTNIEFMPMIADITNNAWIDCYSSAFVKRNSIGSGLGMHNALHAMDNNELAEPGDHMVDFSNPLGTGGRFPITNKVGVSNNYSFSTSGSVVANFGFNYTRSDSRGKSDMMDMNGDGYPDAVTSREIQYTLPNGDLSSKKLNFDDEVYTSFSKGNAFGGSLSFKPSVQKEKNTNPKSADKNISTTAAAENTLAALLGVSVNKSYNKVVKTYADVNSDGLPDIIEIDDNSHTYVEYNLGYKFSESYPIEISNIEKNSSATIAATGSVLNLFSGCFNIGNYSLSGGFGTNMNMSEGSTTMLDINSDGMIDIISVNRGHITAYLNNGREFVRYEGQINAGINKLSSSETDNISGNVSGTFGFPIYFVKVTASVYADVLYSISNEKIRLMDINGDGAVDILNLASDAISVKYGKPQRRNLLKTVISPALGQYEMAYSMLYPDADNPNHKWIMTALKVSDNDGGFEDGNDALQYRFEYSGMKYHRIERESYGFAEVTTKVVDNWSSERATVLRQQKEYYITENGLRHGLKYRDEVLDNRNNLQTRTDYKWTLNDLNTGEPVEDSECVGDRELYPRLESEQITVYGESNTLTNMLFSRKSYVYTKYGNISQYIYKYNPNEWVVADMEYYDPYSSPMTNIRLLDKLKSIIVKSHNGQIMRKMERSYYSNGDIGKVRKYYTDNNYATTMFGYDGYGNINRVIYPIEGPDQQRVEYTYTYDDATNTYLSSLTDAFGCSTQLSEYDYRFGKPTKVLGQNGTLTQYTYYSDGKIKTIKAPTDPDADYSLKVTYWTDLSRSRNIRWAKVEQRDALNDGNKFVTKTISDGLGRTMQTARKSVVNGEVMDVVSGKNIYDEYGRVVQTFQPEATVYRDGVSLHNDNFRNPTKYKYDCIDRQLSVTTPDGNMVQKKYFVSNDLNGNPAMLVITKYPLERTIKSYTDARGLQTATVARSESGDIETGFVYSPMGELLKTQNPEGHTTSYDYDMLGRLIKRRSPDAGTTKFHYDIAGNLVSKATQKLLNRGAEITYEYDRNRLIAIHYPEVENNQMDVYYEYGEPGTLNAGLVTKRQDGVSVQSYSYNEMGEVVNNIRTFAMPSDERMELMTFETSWEYDTWGRTKSITYPDGELVKYKYDNAGKVKGMGSGESDMSDIVSNIKYDKYGNRTYIEYGNHAHNEYQYDELSLQLTHMTSVGSDDAVLQDISYAYDNVYNITEIHNRAEENRYDYAYTYDKLNRLIRAEGSTVVGDFEPFGYLFEMGYSPAGRILSYSLHGRNLEDDRLNLIDQERSYMYENRLHPHAPTSIGSIPSLAFRYSWDANGNLNRVSGLRQSDTRGLYFNEENRLASISDRLLSERINFNNTVSGPVSAYLYDADGERVFKLFGMATAIYRNGQLVNSDLELDRTSFYPTQQMTIVKLNLYKHYFIGNERISSDATMWNPRSYLLASHLRAIHGNFTSLTSGVREQVRRALDSVGYRGDINYYNYNGNYNSSGCSQRLYYHYNHQGSVSVVTNMVGHVHQHLQYLPYGGIFVDVRGASVARRQPAPSPNNPDLCDDFWSPYTFSAKEKDSESGYNYFGARYYTDNIMMWLSVDPMSDERPWISPYNYCQWNPIGRVDTWGMLDDDYSVDKMGNIKLEKKTDDNFDRLYTKDSWDSGTKENYIQLDKGILDKQQQSLTFDFDKDYEFLDTYHFFRIEDDATAKQLFEFVADNSDVEWAYVKTDQKGANNFVSTSHIHDKEKSARRLNNNGHYKGNIIHFIHNHPSDRTSNPSKADIEVLKDIRGFSSGRGKNTIFEIYQGGSYFPYDENYYER